MFSNRFATHPDRPSSKLPRPGCNKILTEVRRLPGARCTLTCRPFWWNSAIVSNKGTSKHARPPTTGGPTPQTVGSMAQAIDAFFAKRPATDIRATAK